MSIRRLLSRLSYFTAFGLPFLGGLDQIDTADETTEALP